MTISMIDPRMLASAVESACRAPSVHNSQPWHWIVEGGELRLFFAPSRVPHITDRTGRLPFAAPAAWAAFLPVLLGTVDTENPTPEVLPEAVRPQLAEASRLTESLHRYESSYHAELQWWIAPFETTEGVPHRAPASASEGAR
ncbi:MAG: hypothetical protein QNL98_02670 [Mycobacterium sp.]